MFVALMQSLFNKRTSRSVSRRRTTSLRVEPFEDRLLLALFIWTGGDNANNLNWSNRLNWFKDGSIADIAPGANDDVKFDGTGTMGRRYDSIVDANFVGTVKNLTIENTYDKIITLNINLTVNFTTSIAGATVTGNSHLYIGDHPPVGPPVNQAVFNWTGGSLIGPNTSRVFTNTISTVTISGTAEKILSGRILYSHGTLNWNGGGRVVINGQNSGISIESGGVANFQLTATATIEGNATLQVSTGATLNSTVTNGEASIKASFVNNGSVNVNQGNVTLYKTSRNSGVITVANGSVLVFESGTGVDHYLDSTQGGNQSIITGTGQAFFKSGSKIHLTGTANVANVTDFSDVVDGTGALQINGDYNWFGKKWTGTGSVQVGTQTVTSPKLWVGTALSPINDRTLERTLVNYGTVTWLSDDITVSNNGKFDNKAGALFDIKTDKRIIKGTGAGNFTNTGILRKSDGNGEAVIELLLAPMTGGRIEILQNKGTLKYQERMTMQGGEIEIDPAATLLFAGGFDLNGGTVTVNGTGTLNVTGTLVQNGGTVTLNGGTLATTSTYSIQSGTLTNIGDSTIQGHVSNAGRIYVGGDGTAGILRVTGNYTQTTTGRLGVDIRGPNMGTQYDRLIVTGTANLAGTLDVRTIDYDPSLGLTFDVITYGSVLNDFTAWTGMSLGTNKRYDHAPLALAYRLTVVEGIASGEDG